MKAMRSPGNEATSFLRVTTRLSSMTGCLAAFLPSLYTRGNNFAAIIIMINPVSPITNNIGAKALKVSLSVRLLILQISQNPASFIHGINFDPQPMASPRYKE
jgi:hypothetical protein